MSIFKTILKYMAAVGLLSAFAVGLFWRGLVYERNKANKIVEAYLAQPVAAIVVVQCSRIQGVFIVWNSALKWYPVDGEIPLDSLTGVVASAHQKPAMFTVPCPVSHDTTLAQSAK